MFCTKNYEIERLKDFINMKLEFINSLFIQEMKFTQSQESGDKYLQIIMLEDAKKTKVIIKNPYPHEDSFDIVYADRIWIENEKESQKEYAKFKIGYRSDEAYTEFWADSVTFSLIE